MVSNRLKNFMMIDIRKVYVAENRSRKDFGSIEELANVIEQVGLLHPITVMPKEVIIGEKIYSYVLAAGERRYKALFLLAEKNKDYSIPVRIIKETTEYDLAIIEGIENDSRKGFTISEEIYHRAKVHRLLTDRYGKALPGTGQGQTLQDSAKLLGTSLSQLSKDVAMAKELSELPEEVRQNFEKLGSRSEMERAIVSMKKDFSTSVVAKAVEQLGHAEGVKLSSALATGKMGQVQGKPVLVPQVKSNVVIPGGKRDWKISLVDNYFLYPPSETPHQTGGVMAFLDTLAVDSVDFMEIDPPYGIDLPELKKSTNGEATKEYVDIPENVYAEFIHNLIRRVERAMKPNSWGVIWYADIWESVIRDRLSFYKLSPSRSAIWFKTNASGQTMNPKLVLASMFESFIYFRKGVPELKQMGRGNVFSYSPISGEKKLHPAERPPELIKELFKTFVGTPAEVPLIVSPFAGSGRTLLEAYKMGWDCKGCDVVELYKSRFVLAASQEVAGKE